MWGEGTRVDKGRRGGKRRRMDSAMMEGWREKENWWKDERDERTGGLKVGEGKVGHWR